MTTELPTTCGAAVRSSDLLASDEQTKDFMRWFGMATGLWADFDAAPPAGKEMWRRKATEYHKTKLANEKLTGRREENL